jgi:hypothetical protein
MSNINHPWMIRRYEQTVSSHKEVNGLFAFLDDQGYMSPQPFKSFHLDLVMVELAKDLYRTEMGGWIAVTKFGYDYWDGQEWRDFDLSDLRPKCFPTYFDAKKAPPEIDESEVVIWMPPNYYVHPEHLVPTVESNCELPTDKELFQLCQLKLRKVANPTDRWFMMQGLINGFCKKCGCEELDGSCGDCHDREMSVVNDSETDEPDDNWYDEGYEEDEVGDNPLVLIPLGKKK